MEDAVNTPRGGDEEPEVVMLVHANGSYWMYQGEDFIDEVLGKSGYYPKPVRCLMFASSYDLNVYLSRGPARLGDLWSIHPAVVERLRADEELVELTPPPL